MNHCSGSLRERPPDDTFARASTLAASLGISRVTEITRLDRIGLPVFVAIRPDARPGSLCVSAGKGLRASEARVGALMEGIELAWAEPQRSTIAVETATPRALLDGRRQGVLDLCPRLGVIIDLDAPMDCVVATDIDTAAQVLVPAELVFHPMSKEQTGARYFGTGTNGLASGNSVEEATVHALAELIERDVGSFQRARPSSLLIRNASLPPALRLLSEELQQRGFDLFVRSLPNPFRLPCIMALVADRQQPALTLRGDGCHPWSAIAVGRAICESIQARLSLIHGGRDDLGNVWRDRQGTLADAETRYRQALATFANSARAIDFDQLPDHSLQAVDLPSALRLMSSALADVGLRQILRVVYTPPSYPVQVVRVIVPGLECNARDTGRVGPRLRAFVADAK